MYGHQLLKTLRMLLAAILVLGSLQAPIAAEITDEDYNWDGFDVGPSNKSNKGKSGGGNSKSKSSSSKTSNSSKSTSDRPEPKPKTNSSDPPRTFHDFTKDSERNDEGNGGGKEPPSGKKPKPKPRKPTVKSPFPIESSTKPVPNSGGRPTGGGGFNSGGRPTGGGGFNGGGRPTGGGGFNGGGRPTGGGGFTGGGGTGGGEIGDNSPVKSPPETIDTITKDGKLLITKIIDPLNVETNKAFKKGWVRNPDGTLALDANGKKIYGTWCNKYAAEIAKRWSDATGRNEVILPKDVLANDLESWLRNEGRSVGWEIASARDAQTLANRGWLAVAVSYKAPIGGKEQHGHIAVVRPGRYSEQDGPTITQAGAKNYREATARKGFGSQYDDAFYYVIKSRSR